MKIKMMFCSIVLLLSAFTGSVFGGTEINSNTFYGQGAGVNTTGDYSDTFIGANAGFNNTIGVGNVFLGYQAGYNETGSNRLYIGNSSTSVPLIYGEFDNGIVTINGRLGISKSPGVSYELDVNGAVNATSFTGDGSGLTNLNEMDPKVGNLIPGRWCMAQGGPQIHCTHPAPVMTEVDPKVGPLTAGGWCTSDGSTVSCTQTAPTITESDPKVGSNNLNYVPKWNGSALVSGSVYDDGTDVTILANLNVVAPDNGLIYLTNVTTDNTTKASRIVLNHYSNSELPVYLFGAASTGANNFVAFGGGNTIGNAATQLDLFTAPNTTTPVGYPRLTIIGNGYVGLGLQNPIYPLEMVSGAFVTTGGVWTNASSREYKDNIEALTTEDAFGTLKELNPVKFAYKKDMTEKHVGFIAEDVPDLVATKDRKGLSPMDIVAVLTKVVQELKAENDGLKAKNESLENRLLAIEATIKASK